MGFVVTQHLHQFGSHATFKRRLVFYETLQNTMYRQKFQTRFHLAPCNDYKTLNSSPIDELGGVVQCSSIRRRCPRQPCEQPPPGTITRNNSVEYLLTQYLPNPYLKREEGWEKPKNKLAHKQQAIATTLCEELQASNCIYKSRG